MRYTLLIRSFHYGFNENFEVFVLTTKQNFYLNVLDAMKMKMLSSDLIIGFITDCPNFSI